MVGRAARVAIMRDHSEAIFILVSRREMTSMRKYQLFRSLLETVAGCGAIYKCRHSRCFRVIGKMLYLFSKEERNQGNVKLGSKLGFHPTRNGLVAKTHFQVCHTIRLPHFCGRVSFVFWKLAFLPLNRRGEMGDAIEW